MNRHRDICLSSAPPVLTCDPIMLVTEKTDTSARILTADPQSLGSARVQILTVNLEDYF